MPIKLELNEHYILEPDFVFDKNSVKKFVKYYMKKVYLNPETKSFTK